MESAWPRTIAASRLVIFRAGSGSRALPGASPGRSAAKLTSSSGALAIAFRQEATERLNGSVGASLVLRNLELEVVLISISPSSRRRPGSIATDGCCVRENYQRRFTERPPGMGPGPVRNFALGRADTPREIS